MTIQETDEEEHQNHAAINRDEQEPFQPGVEAREDYLQSDQQAGTSELCERLQR